MTPGDFASLQEGREGLSTEDYIAWKLPLVTLYFVDDYSDYREQADNMFSEEEDPDDYAFPLNLRSPKKPTPSGSPLPGTLNGIS